MEKKHNIVVVASRHAKNSFFILATLFASYMYGVESGSCAQQQEAKKNIVISFDIDDVMSGTRRVKSSEKAVAYSADLLKSIVKDCPLALKLLEENAGLTEPQLAELEESASGFPDSYLLYPLMDMINMVKSLKAQGYTVIAATNQSGCQHEKYRQLLKQQHPTIDFNELFDAVLTIADTSKVNGNVEDDKPYQRLNPSDNIHVLRQYGLKKTRAAYFKAVVELVESINPQAEKIIHIDDMGENVSVASHVERVRGIRFKVPENNVLSASLDDIHKAIVKLRNDLKTHGVDLLQDKDLKKTISNEEEPARIKKIKLSQEAMEEKQ